VAITILKNVRAVLKNNIIDNATLVIEDGVIIDVGENRTYNDGFDCFRAFCLPGLIDTHSDAIETEVTPRPTITVDPSYALRSLESRLIAAGITTVCHGITFEDCEIRNRTVDMAETLVDVIDERRTKSNSPIDHRILFRVAMRSAAGFESALDRLNVGKMSTEKAIVALEDHAPGHGPFKDINKFRQHVARQTGLAGGQLENIIANEIHKTIEFLPQKEKCAEHFTKLVNHEQVLLLAHDCENENVVKLAHQRGTSVVEFPLTINAARYAIKRGMSVVLGSPNVLRGQSHSGFANAADLICLGLCTNLASDYMPFSLLSSVFQLVEKNILPLHKAIQLVTTGAAKTLGINDRGEVAVGLRADIILVTLDGRWPRVLRVFNADHGGVFDAIGRLHAIGK